MFDPHHRAVYDRLTSSIVINAELEPQPVAEYLSDVRQANQQAPQKKSVTTLGLAMTGCLAIATAMAMSLMTHLRDMSADQRQRTENMVLAGYGMARPARPAARRQTRYPAGFIILNYRIPATSSRRWPVRINNWVERPNG